MTIPQSISSMPPSESESSNRAPRARLACDRCRKKKAKCPGEQPACSLCQRLNQPCTYRRQADNFREFRISKPADNRTEDRLRRLEGSIERIGRLETKIDQLLSNPGLRASSNNLTPAPNEHITDSQYMQANALNLDDSTYGEQATQSGLVPETEEQQTTAPSRPPPHVLEHVIGLYYDFCENQPLPVLGPAARPDHFPDLIIYGIVAVAARYSTNPYFQREDTSPQAFAQKARHVVFRALESCQTDICLLQAICLTTFAYYLDGFVEQANLTLGIGVRIAYSLGLLRPRNSDDISGEEDSSRCCWTLFVLERLFSLGSGTPAPLIDENDLPQYPGSPSLPSHMITAETMSGEMPVDLGIVAYCLQLTETWGKAMKHALRSKLPDESQLPWAADSAYSRITSHAMQFEAICPNKHRWEVARFEQQEPDDLENSRAYWGPWLLGQFIYHSCLALLNHPIFFLGGTPTAFSQLPFSFAQSVSRQAQLHSRWIAHFADLLHRKAFRIVNPFMAYGASIAATVHVFYAATQNQKVSQRARKDFSICMQLVRDVSVGSPSVQNLVRKLEKLQKGPQVANSPPKTLPDLSRPAYTEIVRTVLEYMKPYHVSFEGARVERLDSSVEASSPGLLQTVRSDGTQQQLAPDMLAECLGILPEFTCPDFVQSSLDEWSIGIGNL